jgi:hypothetical protein
MSAIRVYPGGLPPGWLYGMTLSKKSKSTAGAMSGKSLTFAPRRQTLRTVPGMHGQTNHLESPRTS